MSEPKTFVIKYAETIYYKDANITAETHEEAHDKFMNMLDNGEVEIDNTDTMDYQIERVA